MATLRVVDGNGDTKYLRADGAGTTTDPFVVDHASPADLTQVATGTADVQGIAATTGLHLLGYAVRETTGTAGAVVILRHGTGTGDPQIFPEERLAAKEVAHRWFGPNGLSVANGVFVDRSSGNTELVLYTKST